MTEEPIFIRRQPLPQPRSVAMNSSNELEIVAKDMLRHLPAEAVLRRANGTLEYSLVALALVGLTMVIVWPQIDPVESPRSGIGIVILWSAVATGTVLIAFFQQLRTYRRANEIESKRLIYARSIFEMESHTLGIVSTNLGSQDPQVAPEPLSRELHGEPEPSSQMYIQVPRIISVDEEEAEISNSAPVQEAVG